MVPKGPEFSSLSVVGFSPRSILVFVAGFINANNTYAFFLWGFGYIITKRIDY